ncbi:MAG: methylated-DNA--[protein]-cysteine S-methyltransferase [candidate division WOR-3 bacterium]
MRHGQPNILTHAIVISTPVGGFCITLAGGEIRSFSWNAPLIPRVDPRHLPSEPRRFVRAIEEYFGSGRWNFSWFRLPTPFWHVSEKALLVYDYLRREVGPGNVITYRELGRATGTHPRGIGSILRSNPWPIVVPCHRVIGSGGSLVGYAGGIDKKAWLLKLEGRL